MLLSLFICLVFTTSVLPPLCLLLSAFFSPLHLSLLISPRFYCILFFPPIIFVFLLFPFLTKKVRDKFLGDAVTEEKRGKRGKCVYVCVCDVT